MSGSRTQRVLGWCWLGLRCARLVLVLPAQLRRSSAGSQRLVEAYDRTVGPIVRRHVSSRSRAEGFDHRLLGWAVQGGYLVDSYAQMVGRMDADEVAVVAASFMRLYDDLLEQDGRRLVGARLADLFAGAEVPMDGEVEAIVAELFTWLDRDVSQANRDLLYGRLADLHSLQLEVVDAQSRRDPDEVLELTIRKGGAAMVILGGLVNRQLDRVEVAALDRLGGLLQLIDDYDDQFEDSAVLTSANWAHVPFGALAAELRPVARQLLDLHGSKKARPFIDGLYSWLVLVGFRRLLDRFIRRRSIPTSVPEAGLAMLTYRKQHLR
jgi:hypothetical protein